MLVLQGGGALGAYQAGVFQALDAAGIAPDWVIGTSIGAINAALIAGSKPGERLEKLREFWRRVEHGRFLGSPLPNWFTAAARNMMAVTTGVPAFFSPNPAAFFSQHAPLGAEAAGYYSTEPLAKTLGELIDWDQVNDGSVRLTVGAAKVQTSEMVYFDSRDMRLGLPHVMASGALPPAFPAVRIDGELYWDGGILSNTPVEVVFDDVPRRNAVVFAVHLWNPHGAEPDTLWSVMNRQKDLQYSSRAASHIRRQRQLHHMRHIIAELAARLPGDALRDNSVAEMASWGAKPECTSSACSRRCSAMKIMRRTWISVPMAFVSAGKPAIATPAKRSKKHLGARRPTRWRVSFCTRHAVANWWKPLPPHEFARTQSAEVWAPGSQWTEKSSYW